MRSLARLARRTVAFLRNEAKGEGGTFLSWEWIEKISYEQLVAAETYDFAGYEGHGFARPRWWFAYGRGDG